MNIRIFQINMERDSNNVCFTSYESLSKFQGSQDIDSKIYDLIFEGNVDCKTLEDVYQIFNCKHPEGYKGRLLSKSDVVEIIDETDGKSTFHFCDSIGFKEIDFSPKVCQVSPRFLKYEPQEKIKVLLVQPGKYPKEVSIGNTLEAMQAIVGGDIEEYMPFEDEVAIITNDESKLLGLPLNRAVYAEPETVNGYTKREMIDIIAGDFFIAYAPVGSEKFLSLPDNLMKKYHDKFKYPERFLRTSDGIKAVPYKPDRADKDR